MTIHRVIASDAAKSLIERLRGEHGPLMFHQSGGCCDGSSPMCFVAGEFRTGDSDVLVGTVEGCPFYMARDQFRFFAHTQLEVDVVDGRGASFSLEIPHGVRFVIRSRVFSEAELALLPELVESP